MVISGYCTYHQAYHSAILYSAHKVCFFYASQNKRRLLIGFYNRDGKCLLRGTKWNFKQKRSDFVPEALMHNYGTCDYTQQSSTPGTSRSDSRTRPGF